MSATETVANAKLDVLPVDVEFDVSQQTAWDELASALNINLLQSKTVRLVHGGKWAHQTVAKAGAKASIAARARGARVLIELGWTTRLGRRDGKELCFITSTFCVVEDQ